jgi:Tfp pilus assembly protein FimT
MRDVERELQTARLKAVSTNRPMRVYFNCPSVGRYRMVEVLGVAAVDNASDRCAQTRFTFPSPRDADPNTPANDGPLREVPQGINLSPTNPSLILQFAPNGQTTRIFTGAPQLLGTTGLDLVVESARSYSRKTVNINGLGRIQIK